MKLSKVVIGILALGFAAQGVAASAIVKMYATAKTGKGAYLGKIEFADTKKGLLIEPHLKGLPPGLHGFHVHAKPSCGNYGLDAGGHLDPADTEHHLGPFKKGHLGDLPVLQVAKNGKTNAPLLAPRLKVKDIRKHAVIIHAGGDNYSDKPKPLGGGGARIACGVVR